MTWMTLLLRPPRRAALLAATALVGGLALPAATWAGAHNITVQGRFTLADDAVLADPTGGNALGDWVGRSFSVTLGWADDPAQAIGVSDHHADNTRTWAFTQLTGGFAVQGGASHDGSVFNFVSVRNDWAYDGSAGILPAGVYDEIAISGTAAGCPAVGPEPLFGTCIYTPGWPANYSFSVSILGPADFLADGGLTYPGPDTPLAAALLVSAEVTLYTDGNRLIGAVESHNTAADRLSSLSITTAVPEPAPALLMLVGLGCLWRHRPLQRNKVGLGAGQSA